MAGDWIKLEHATPNKPEIYRLARILGVSRGDAFLLAVEWWVWLDRNSCNGNVTLLLRQDVDELMDCPGFAAAMESVGWLKFSDEQTMLVVNFNRHNGKTSKERALTKDRVQRLRNADVTAKPLPEKRREEIDNSLRSLSSARKKPRTQQLETPSAEHEAIAVDRGLDCKAEFAKYRDWQASTGRRHKDEVAGFRNWLRNARVARAVPADRVSNIDILTGKRHGRDITGIAERVDSAVVLTLPGDLREPDGGDVEERRPDRSATNVG